MKVLLCEDINWLLSEEAFYIYSTCMYKPSAEKYRLLMEHYLTNPDVKIFVCEDDTDKVVSVIFARKNDIGYCKIKRNMLNCHRLARANLIGAF